MFESNSTGKIKTNITGVCGGGVFTSGVRL